MQRVRRPELRECEWLAAAGELHRGLIKKTNQDCVVIWGPGLPVVERAGGGYLFGVVDGMGSTHGGDIAARRTVETLLEYYTRGGPRGPDQVEALLHEANRRVCLEQRTGPDRDDMGCVATFLWADEDRLEIFHLGDTRAYGVRAEGITQFTQDDRDQLGRVANWIGNSRGLTVARRTLDPADWDFLLLCSDGVPAELSEARLLDIVQAGREPAKIVQEMLEAALSERGRDNLSVVCVELY